MKNSVKLKVTKGSVLRAIKEYVLMTVGMIIYSFGWLGCIIPAGGVGGGATGLSLLIVSAMENWAGVTIQVGTLVFFINAALLVVAGFLVGWNFGIKTIYCIVVASLTMNGWDYVVNDIFAGDVFHLNNNFLLIILGGIACGIGVALCFQQGGSTGGTDIVAMIINKYRTISYGKIVRYSDFVIIGASLLVGYEINAVVYGYIMTFVFSNVADMLLSGSSQSSQIFIFSRNYEAIADAMTAAGRGATLIDGMGWYNKSESKVVILVCRKRDLSSILKEVKAIDSDAFITVGSVMGVYGKGFSALSKV